MSVNNDNKGWYWHSPTDQRVLSYDAQKQVCVEIQIHVSYLVHAVLLNSKFSSVSMRGFGHGLQLLLLQAGVLRRHRLTQTVDAVQKEERVRSHILHFSTFYVDINTRGKKWFALSLYVLLMSWARHRLGPPALLLLRYVILEKTWHWGEWRMELNFRSAVRRTKRETDEWNVPQSPGQSPSRHPRHLQPHWLTVLLLPSTCLEQLTLKHKEHRLQTNRIQTGREIRFNSSGWIQISSVDCKF